MKGFAAEFWVEKERGRGGRSPFLLEEKRKENRHEKGNSSSSPLKSCEGGEIQLL